TENCFMRGMVVCFRELVFCYRSRRLYFLRKLLRKSSLLSHTQESVRHFGRTWTVRVRSCITYTEICDAGVPRPRIGRSMPRQQSVTCGMKLAYPSRSSMTACTARLEASISPTALNSLSLDPLRVRLYTVTS